MLRKAAIMLDCRSSKAVDVSESEALFQFYELYADSDEDPFKRQVIGTRWTMCYRARDLASIAAILVAMVRRSSATWIALGALGALAACHEPAEQPPAPSPPRHVAEVPASARVHDAALRSEQPCPDLEITFNGKRVSLPTALARSHSNGALEISLWSRAITCADELAPSVAVKPSDLLVSVIARMTPDSVALEQADWDNDIIDIRDRLVGPAPSAPGDVAALCVPDRVTLHGNMLYRSTDVVTLVGLVRARYCGRLDL